MVQFEIPQGVPRARDSGRLSPCHQKLKVGDAVFYGDPPLSYLVEDVDYGAKTADIRTTTAVVAVHQNIAWSELTLLDESQNTAPIVRETTENM